MANDNGGTYDPQGGRENPEGEGGRREIVPWDYPTMETSASQMPYPAGRAVPKQPPPPIPVKRRTLSMMMAMIVVLLLVVGGLAFAVLSSSKTPVAAAVPAPSSASPSAVGPTGAATDLSPSPEVSASPSDSSSDTATPGATDTSTPGTSDSATASAGFSPPFGSQPLGNPVDGDVDTGQDEHVSNLDYPDSILLWCPTNGMLDWNVAGFTTFTTVFGIPDNAESATGIINTVTFSDQNGHVLGTAKTSLGQPAHVQFALKGATRLVMTCDRQGSNDSTDNRVTLAAPVLSTS